jgi:hypothetical protein
LFSAELVQYLKTDQTQVAADVNQLIFRAISACPDLRNIRTLATFWDAQARALRTPEQVCVCMNRLSV